MHFCELVESLKFPKEPLCILYRVGRTVEAKDAARGALKSPWWTLGCSYQVSTFIDHLSLPQFPLQEFFCDIMQSNTYTSGSC